MAKSPQALAHAVRLNWSEVMPAPLRSCNPMKMAEPSPFEVELPFSLWQSPKLSQTCAVNATKKSAWICAPAEETHWLNASVSGPLPPLPAVQIRLSPKVKLPDQSVPCSRSCPQHVAKVPVMPMPPNVEALNGEPMNEP